MGKHKTKAKQPSAASGLEAWITENASYAEAEVELDPKNGTPPLQVRIRQLTNHETVAALAEATAANVPVQHRGMWVLAKACVEPAFKPKQLVKLYERDRVGEAMVNVLADAVNALNARDIEAEMAKLGEVLTARR